MSGKLSASSKICHFCVIIILYAVKLVCCLFLDIIKVLYCVYYLTKLNCELLLADGYLIELQDLGLVLSIDSLLVNANF